MGDIAGSFTGHTTEKIPTGQRIGLWTPCKNEREENRLVHTETEVGFIPMGPAISTI